MMLPNMAALSLRDEVPTEAGELMKSIKKLYRKEVKHSQQHRIREYPGSVKEAQEGLENARRNLAKAQKMVDLKPVWLAQRPNLTRYVDQAYQDAKNWVDHMNKKLAEYKRYNDPTRNLDLAEGRSLREKSNKSLQAADSELKKHTSVWPLSQGAPSVSPPQPVIEENDDMLGKNEQGPLTLGEDDGDVAMQSSTDSASESESTRPASPQSDTNAAPHESDNDGSSSSGTATPEPPQGSSSSEDTAEKVPEQVQVWRARVTQRERNFVNATHSLWTKNGIKCKGGDTELKLKRQGEQGSRSVDSILESNGRLAIGEFKVTREHIHKAIGQVLFYTQLMRDEDTSTDEGDRVWLKQLRSAYDANQLILFIAFEIKPKDLEIKIAEQKLGIKVWWKGKPGTPFD